MAWTRPKTTQARSERLRSIALRLVVIAVVGGLGALITVLGTRWPSAVVGILLLAPALLWAAWTLTHQPIERSAVLAVVGIQTATLGAGMWLLDPFNSWLDLLRGGGAAGTIAILGAYMGSRLPASPVRTTALIALAYCVWTIVGGQFAYVPGRSAFVGVSLIGLVCVVLLAFSTWKEPVGAWTGFVAGTHWVGGALCLGCLFLALIGMEAARAPRMVGDEAQTSFRGLFLNSGLMGEVGALTVAAGLALRAARPHIRFNAAMYTALGLGTATMMASASRASLLGVAAGVLTFWLTQRGSSTRYRGVLLGGLTTLAVIGLLNELGAIDTTLRRLTSDGGGMDIQGEGRLVLWRMSLQSFFDNPLTGLGFGSIPASAGHLEARVSGQLAAHSVIVEYMLAPGAPGFVLFGWLVVRAVQGLLTFPDRSLVRSICVYGAVMVPIYLTGTSCSPVGMLPYALWLPLLLAATLPSWRIKPADVI